MGVFDGDGGLDVCWCVVWIEMFDEWLLVIVDVCVFVVFEVVL